MFTKNIHLIILTISVLFFSGCKMQSTQHLDAQEISAICNEKFSDPQFREILSYWVTSKDSLGVFIQELKKNEPITNLVLALILSHPKTSFRNTEQALRRLNFFDHHWSNDDHNKRFDTFLKKQLEDRKRMLDKHKVLRLKIAEFKQGLTQEQDKASAAKAPLNQLKLIKKSLLLQ